MVAQLRSVKSREDAFVAQVDQMPMEYLECRSSQHLMVTTSRFRLVDTAKEDAWPHKGHRTYLRREMTCSRCGKKRHDFYFLAKRRGRFFVTKINASYGKLPGYDVTGLGRVPGNRGLVLGVLWERILAEMDDEDADTVRDFHREVL